ncbi:flagellin [Lysobacter sp. D1-1-M9]|uniref:flagellin n=2 Tax=Novilysobacter TaxID=3382699 RepID=UPI002FC5FE4E
MQVINSNIMSLNAQRNLSTTGGDLATSLQRLSSGLRINSAKDDAAGLAISERFTTQIRGMDQAARNANDGISLSQTAEGAMGEIGNNLQRIRELAVQSRNATNSATDREALNKEAQQLKAEINRVAGQTAFNGVKLLDGSFENQTFQVGANQGETINVAGIVDASSVALGTWTSVDTSTFAASVTGVAPTANSNLAAGDLTINGVDVGAVTGGVDAAAQGAAVAAAINGVTGDTGVSAAANATTGVITLTSTSEDGIVIAGATANEAATESATGLTFATTAATETVVAGTAQTGFDSLDISTAEGADAAMLAMDGALSAINTARADMGAVQNRFTSVVANLGSNSENLSAARSRIQDADFAAETAQLTRNQILQQAGTAMLAQANQAPQNVLSLLR